MNSIFKYVLLLIGVIFSIGCFANIESTPEEECIIEYEIQMDVLSNEETPVSDYGLCPSNYVNLSSAIAELGRTIKRFENFKQTSAFIKTDKVINVGVKYSLQDTSINFFSNITEPNYRLVSMRKLVI